MVNNLPLDWLRLLPPGNNVTPLSAQVDVLEVRELIKMNLT